MLLMGKSTLFRLGRVQCLCKKLPEGMIITGMMTLWDHHWALGWIITVFHLDPEALKCMKIIETQVLEWFCGILSKYSSEVAVRLLSPDHVSSILVIFRIIN